MTDTPTPKPLSPEERESWTVGHHNGVPVLVHAGDFDLLGIRTTVEMMRRYEATVSQLEQRVAELEEEIGDYQDASMLMVGGDPGGVTPRHVQREIESLRRVVRSAFDEVTEGDGWRTEWWAEEWVPMAEDVLAENPTRRALTPGPDTGASHGE